jgi:hypothetical protein
MITVLSVVIPAGPAAAQVITDLSYDLAALSEVELLLDWTAFGTGVRAGIAVTTTGDTRYYTHSGLSLDNGEAFLIDMVASAESLGADGERGARMWVRFRDAAMPPLVYRHVEARLFREAGTSRVGLFNNPSAPIAAYLGSLPQDWTNISDRLRVRIRHQEVAGVSTVFLVAENSSQWTPDLLGPLAPDATNTFGVAVNDASFPPLAASTEFGFGNAVAGTYSASYETVRIIRSSEPDTVLPAPLVLNNIPTSGWPGFAVFTILLAIGGWVLLIRPKP